MRYSQSTVREPKDNLKVGEAEAISDGLDVFHPVTAAWFRAVFDAPTAPQRAGWPVIARGESALILAPTGTGKTLTAFLWCLDRLMLGQRSEGRDQRSEIRGWREWRVLGQGQRVSTRSSGTSQSATQRVQVRGLAGRGRV